MPKKTDDPFYQAPSNTNRTRSVLNWSRSTYSKLEDVDGTQPYYKYQGIGNITGKQPDPPPPVYEGVLTVGNFNNAFYGFENQGGIGTLNPPFVAGKLMSVLGCDTANQFRIETIDNSKLNDLDWIEITLDGFTGSFRAQWDKTNGWYGVLVSGISLWMISKEDFRIDIYISE